MNDDQRSLRDIAQAASDRHGGAKGRELDRVAKKAGLRLSYTTFDRILSGTYTSVPSAATIEALAVLAGADPREVYAAAGRPYPLGRFADQLPDDADLLDGAQREAVIAVVRQFAAANRALHEAKGGGEHDSSAATTEPESGPANQPDTSPVRLAPAARKVKGKSAGRRAREEQDQSGEAPDPEGPEGGA